MEHPVNVNVMNTNIGNCASTHHSDEQLGRGVGQGLGVPDGIVLIFTDGNFQDIWVVIFQLLYY